MWSILLISIIITYTFAYDESISQIAVNLSQASYCVSSSWNCLTCTDENILEAIIESHGERVLMGYNTNLHAIFVSFRGSSNIQNWLDDIQFHKVYPYNDSDIGVEKGFYKAYQNVKSDIFETLTFIQDKYSTKKVLLTGHSLGAALATLMAFDIKNIYSMILYTYGSPRVGNSEFVAHFHTTTNRITHYYDIVPHLPEQAFGFLHIPQEIWYNEENTEFETCNDDTQHEDELCSNSCGPLHCTSTSDHLNYVNTAMGSSACNPVSL
jgi:hypothetical protein